MAATFVSKAALHGGLKERLGSKRRFLAVSDTRGVRRTSLLSNTLTPELDVELDGSVSVGGRVLTSSPVDTVPMSARHLLR